MSEDVKEEENRLVRGLGDERYLRRGERKGRWWFIVMEWEILFEDCRLWVEGENIMFLLWVGYIFVKFDSFGNKIFDIW